MIRRERLTLILVVGVFSQISFAQNPIVQIDDGQIEGIIMKSRLGFDFASFRGIPFAEPPLGELRFQNPIPIKAWTGILDATKDGPMCSQPSDLPNSEDCLLLNVYTKELPINGQLKPVIAYIHGGGFYAGSAVSAVYTGPRYLMDRDLVLVTINYRLGSLGFMSTGTKDAPGNAGFKDQALGLRWIQKNIAKFGGNPDLVTIAGQSAGAMSVSAHLVAEMSRGLFHRAIAMSGSITAQWTIGRDQLHLAKKQARLVNCTDINIEEMVNCLKLIPATELANSLNGFKDVDGSPILLWVPVIEQDFGQDRFLTDHPEVLFSTGNFSRVPVMTGITRDEFISPVKNILLNETWLKMINDDFNTVAPLCFLYDNTGEKSNKISQELRSAFLPYDVIDERAFTGLNFLFADGVISYGVHRVVHLMAKFTDVFYYKYIYHGQYSHFYYPRANESYGIEHADDLLYVMNRGHIAPIFEPTDPEALAVERSTRMWEYFAYTGNPNNENDTYLNKMEWNKFELSKENYLEIGTHLVEKNGLFLERFRVWDRLFPPILSFTDTQNLIVTIENGRIEGTTMQSRKDNQFYAFRGIPYAQPPIGNLRFEAPLAAVPWSGILDATKDGPICPQQSSDNLWQSEDCLQLNVYTQKLPIIGEVTKLKPVIAYIHGGGFTGGSGISENFAGPQFLMDRDIVLVTINYRLASLGFLATGTKEAPGNAGFKDQVLALKWIQKNIAKFGGNPDLVTIAGQSAGGRCVSLHMVSEMSNGLFHRAIALSGAMTPQWAIGHDQIDLAKKQAQLLDCSVDNIEDMVRCLKQVKYEDLVNTMSNFKDAGGNPIIVYKPVVELDFGQERFLKDTPINLFRAGNFSRVPVITGVVRDEFSSLAFNVLNGKNDLLKNFTENFDDIAPVWFLIDKDGEKSKNIGRELKNAYLPYDDLDDRAFGGLNMLFSDAVTGFTVHRFVHLISNYTKVFYYKNVFVERFSEFYYPKDNIPFGVHHADDLMYILYLKNKTPLFTQSDPENIAVERATRMWENFALSGNPNNPDDVFLKDMIWNEFDLKKENYLEIGTNLVEKNGLFLERYKVWEMLFPLEPSSSITLSGNIMFVLIIIAFMLSL